eukprot:4383571-Heterocapsa_arctica.AAC.1
MGPPVGFSDADPDPPLFEWSNSLNCIMPAVVAPPRPRLRTKTDGAILEPNARTSGTKQATLTKKRELGQTDDLEL